MSATPYRQPIAGVSQSSSDASTRRPSMITAFSAGSTRASSGCGRPRNASRAETVRDVAMASSKKRLHVNIRAPPGNQPRATVPRRPAVASATTWSIATMSTATRPDSALQANLARLAPLLEAAAGRRHPAPDRRCERSGLGRRHVFESLAGRRIADLPGGARHGGRRRPRGAGGTQGIPGVAGLPRYAAPGSAACNRRRHRAARRRHRRARELGQRAADSLHVEGGAPRRGELPLLRRPRRVRARRGCATDGYSPELHGADADRSGRRDHTLEHAVHAVDLEDRAGARGGLYRGPQARRVEPGHGAASRRDCPRGGSSAGGAQRRARHSARRRVGR